MGVRQYLILILTAFLLVIGFTVYDQLARQRGTVPWKLDFTKFYLSARALDAGGDMYLPVSVSELGPLPADFDSSRETLHPNLNTPFVNLLLWPFAYTDLPTAARIWTFLSFGCVLGAAWALAGVLLPAKGFADFQRWMAAGLLALVLLVYYPSLANAALGQFGQVLLAALASAWLAARRGDDRLAGILFGLALALKLFTGLFLLIFPWLRRWRLLSWYAGTYAALTLGSVLIAGPGAFLRYTYLLGEVNWHASGWNASLMAPLSILFGSGGTPGWFHHPWLGKLIWLAASTVLCAVLVTPIRMIKDQQQQVDLAVAGAMPLMLIISPLGWLYYFPVLWIAAAAVFATTRTFKARRPWRIATIGALLICGIPYPFVLAKDASASFSTLLTTSADTGALFVTYTVVAGIAWHMARQGHAPERRSGNRIPSYNRLLSRPTCAPNIQEIEPRFRQGKSQCR